MNTIQDKINELDSKQRGQLSDTHHTFDELYEFRKMYNALLFNEWAKINTSNKMFTSYPPKYEYIPKFNVHKSWKHSDGEWCFGEEKKWFIVSAMLPTGLISNHYKAKDWELFKVPEVEKALFEFDGHSGIDVLERLEMLLKSDEVKMWGVETYYLMKE